MAHSSILGGERAAQQASGRDTDALGPSDTSDSGSDVQGELPIDPQGFDFDKERLGADRTIRSADTDAGGTGERSSALPDERVRDGADVSPDHITTLAGEGLDGTSGETGDETLTDELEGEPSDETEDSDVHEHPR